MNILITERFSPDGEVYLKNLGHKVRRSADYAQPTEAELAFADILIIRSKTQIYSGLLQKAQNLRLIITTTSGFDHIDQEACKHFGVQWTYTPYANQISAGELTLGLALQGLRQLHLINKQTINGFSNKSSLVDRRHFMGHEIHGKTWGIVGLGRVGRYVSKLVRGFGANLLAYDPYLTDDVFQKYQVERVSLAELFKLSDIVSLHVPKTDQTHHFITLRLLKDLGPQGLLINMARSHVLCIQTLLDALNQKRIGLVALDVFDRLPPDIFKFPNVVLSPHLGGATYEAMERASYQTIEIIKKFQSDGVVSSKNL